MEGQSAVVTLRAYGSEARSDGLGNVQARVSHLHPDATQTSCWVTVPTDSGGLLGWLARTMAAPPPDTHQRQRPGRLTATSSRHSVPINRYPPRRNTVYSQLTEIEANDRRERVTEQYRAAQRRHRRVPHAHDERRWHSRHRRHV